MRKFNLFNHSSGQGESKLSPSCLLLNPYLGLTRLLQLRYAVVALLLTIGVGNMWGADTQQTYTLNSSDNNSQKATGSVTWNIGNSAIGCGGTNCSLKKLQGTITVTLPTNAQLNSVTINKGSNWGGDARVQFKSGSTTLNTFSTSGTFSLTNHKTDLTYTFTHSGSGNAWVSSITVSYAISASPATITLSEAGTTSSVSGTHYSGDSYTLPTSTEASCNSKVLVGWSTVTVAETNTKPASNFYEKGESVTLAAGANIFYAVFASASAGGTGRIEINTTNSGVTGSYDDLDFTVGGINFLTTQWCKSTNIQAKKNTTYSLYNKTAFPGNITSIKVKQTGTNRAITIHGRNYYSEDDAEEAGDEYIEEAITPPSTAATMVFNFTGKAFKYFYLTTPGNAVYMDSVVINYSSVSYSAYSTSCCTPLGSINGSFNVTKEGCTPTQLKATWFMKANTGIASQTLKVYKKGGTYVKDVNIATVPTSKHTETIDGLDPCTEYYVELWSNSAGGNFCADEKVATSSDVETGSYSVSYTGSTNVNHSDVTTACASADLSITFSAVSVAYVLPGTISVTIGGNAATAGTDYTWTQGTGVLSIAAAKQTGNIVIDVDAVEVGCAADPTVTNEVLGLNGSGTFSLSQVDVSTSGWSTGSNTCEWAEYGFVWGTSANPTVGGSGCETEQVGTSGNATSWNGSLTGDFSTGVTYHYRAYAKNSKTSAAYVYSTTEGTFTPYTVSYNKNDENATGEVATVVVNAGGSVTLPNASAFSLDCNDMTKWALNSAEGTQYNPEATYSNINANAEFFAIWNKRTYTISYATGTTPLTGAAISGSKDDQTKTCGKNFTLPGVVFTMTGYTQTGWTKTDGGSQTNQLGGSYTSNQAQTFYPVWTINNYTVSKGTATGCSGNDFTLSANNANHGSSITVTASPDETHKGAAQVSVSPAGNATVSGTTISNIIGDIEVSVSFAAKQAATVKLHVAGTESVVVSSGLEDDSYTLPAVAAECPDLGLYGWYKGTYSHATTAPSGDNFKSKGQTVTLTAGENKFYAVYATIGDPANTYTKITSTGALETGEYLMAGQISNYYGMKNSFYTTNSKMNDAQLSVSDNVASNPDATQIWRITKSTNTITIQSTDDNKYFGFTSNHVALLDDAQDLTYELSEGKWAIYSGSDYLKYESYFQRGTEKVYQAHLFKRDQTITGPYTTDPNCTTHELSYEDPGDEGSIVLGKSVLGEGKTTTATATPSAHYTFSHWTISGTNAELDDANASQVTVTMGTADAVLTAHFTEKEKCTVVFKNNGVTKSSETYWLGENPVAPTLTDGHDHDACDENSTVHYGWTQTTWEETLTQTQVDAKTAADVKVYAKDATLPAIVAGDNGKTIEYHAVWAHETTTKTAGKVIDYDGSGRSTLQAITGVTVSGLGSDYANTHSPNVLKFDDSGDYIQFDLDYAPTSLSFTYKKIAGGGASSMIIQECATSDGDYSNVETLALSGVQNATGTKTTSQSFSQKYIRMYFNKADNVGVGTIVIQGYTGSTTYSAFLTNCCTQLPTIGKISVGSINETGGTASWTWSGATTGVDKNILKVYNTSDVLVKTIDNISGSATSQSISGLEPCTSYYATLTTVAKDGYCSGAEQGQSDNFTTNGWAVHYDGGDETEGALLSNVTKQSGAAQACLTEDYVATFTANTGYKLPNNIIVYIASVEVDVNDAYTWSISNGTGTLSIETDGLSEEIDVRIIGECITPNITADPVDAVYALNEEATPLSVTVEGAGTWCGYQWQSKVGEGDWTNIPSATNSSYTPSTASAGSTTLYRVIVSNIASGCSVSSTSEAATISVSALPVCAQPTFSIAAGTKLGAQSVTLGCETNDATIYYTTNGNDPQEIAANLYDGSAIAISQTTTIKAIAAKSGMTTSGVASATYTIKCKAPTFTVDAGTYNVAQSVELASEYGTVYYTVDGSDPATDGVEYSEAIPVTVSTTIRAIAKMANCENSDEASAEYVLKCATPSFSVAEGVQIGAQNVTLSSTIGASIYYTTNNATPTTSSTLYESAIPVSSAMTIKAIAVKDGWSNSDVATAAYTIKYTLTFQNNGVTLAEGGTKNLAPGEAYGTLPTLTSGACDGTSTTFMGWSTAVITDKQAAAPAYASAETTIGEGHVTLNAVWAKANGSAEDDQEHTWTSPTWTTQTAFGYGTEKTATIDGEDWKYAGYAQNANNYLQVNTGSNKLSYFYLPEYDENFIVKSVAFSLNANSSNSAFFTDTKPTTAASTPDACSNGSFSSSKSLTLNVEDCELTNGYIYFNGSAQVKSVTATYTKVVTYEDYITTCCDEWTATAKYGSNNIINVNDVVAVTVKGDTYGTATYESNKTDVLTVAANGAVTGKKAGSATVTIAWAGIAGSKCAFETTVDVTVNGPITVTYNANDGTLTPATTSQNATSNTAFTLDANSFSRTGYTFQGWATTPSGAKAYDNSQANVSFAEDVTLYAVWALNSHAVTLTQPTGNTITANSSTTPGNVTYGTSVTLSATENETTTDGYIFTSWSVTGITLADATANPAQFTMPDNAVSVSANYTHYTWDLTGYTVETAPETEYSTGDHFSKASVVIQGNYKRSDNDDTKQVAVDAANWTAKLNGTEIADNYTFVIGDHGKTLTLWVGDTQVGENYVLTVNAIPTDHFVINIWTNEVSPIADKTIAYSMPSIDDQEAGDAATCKDHNLFVGWVEADYKDEPEGHIVAANTAMTPSDKTFYAVWAKTGTITESISYGWESTDDATNWSMSASKDGLNAVTAYHKTGEKAGATTSTGAHIRTLSSYATPKSISAQILKQGGNITTGNVFKLQYSNNASDWNDIVTKEFKDLTKEVWFELSYDLSNNDTYKNKYFRVVMVSAANGAIDDVTFTYATSGAVDYITECVQRYQITFDANGGIGSYDAIEKKEGATVTLPDGSALSKQWYKFDGWKVYYATTDEEIAVTENSFTTPAANVNVVAQWQEVSKAKVVYMNGDDQYSTRPNIHEGEEYTIAGKPADQEGKLFIGWKNTLTSDTMKVKDPALKVIMPTPAVDIRYDALWLDVLPEPTSSTVDAADLSNGEWVLVTANNQLQTGDIVIVVAEDSPFALGSTQNSSNRASVSITKSEDKQRLSNPDGNVAKLFLQNGIGAGEYALYDYAYVTNETNGGYLYAAGNSSNDLKTKTSLDRDASWTISIDNNGTATIKAKGQYSHNWLRYNNSSNLFSCYANGQQAVALYKWVKKISGETNLSDVTLTDAVIVTDGATLNVNADKTLDNLTVEAGGKVETTNELTVINNLTINSEAGKSGQVSNAGKVHANNVYMDVTFYKTATELDATSANQWYMISAPFDVNLADGFTLTDGTPMRFAQSGDADSYIFDLFEYDGAKRASTGNTGWKRVQGHMPAGKACLIGFVSGQPTTIRLKAANATLAEKASIALNEYSGDAQNRNWNGVANPNLHYININKDVQIYNNEEGENGRKYLPYTASSYSFVVGTAFFVQETGSISLSAATNGLLRAPKRESERYEACVRIVRDGAETFADQMFVRASEEASNEYEQGHDMITWNGTTAKTALIWSNNYGKRLAIEEAPIVDNKASYALSLYAPADGTYHIETPTESEDATLYLTKDGRAIWNLSMSACEVELSKGTTESYGLLLVRKTPGVATGMENVQSDNVQCTKVIIDNQVFILRGGQMYDLTGKAVK